MESLGKLICHVACYESGIDEKRFYGFGSLWMKYQRRRDVLHTIPDLRQKHNCSNEIKWQKACSKQNSAFYHDLLETFPWHLCLAFNCIVVEKSKVEKAYYSSDHDLAIHRNFNKLIEIKITSDIKVHLNCYCEFRIELNPLPSRYKYELLV